MRIAIAGGGPGGLYLSILLKRLDPSYEVVVHERNAPDDTFGFGVVFSDETLAAFEAADPESYEEITRQFVRWSEIDVHYKGRVITSGGHGFSAMGRKELLGVLQRRAASAGVDLRFRSEVPRWTATSSSPPTASTRRCARTYGFEPSLDRRRATYAWFGTDHVFESFTFIIAETPHGVVQVHAYPYSRTRSHLHRRDAAACSSTGGVRGAVRLPADREPHALDQLHHGAQPVLAARERRAARRRRAHRALLDRLGTKLAMEDAISLAWAVQRRAICDAYEAERRPIVESTQRAAQGSLEWFEGIGRYMHQDPRRSRSTCSRARAASRYGELRMRDPDFVATSRRVAADVHAVPAARRWSWPTASWSRRWTCTRRSTGRPATSTSCTSARARSAAPGW